MTIDFDTLTKSTEESRPIEVYEITLGSTVHRWTSSEDELTIGGNVYEAIPIRRNAVVLGTDQGRRTLQLTVPASNPFAREFEDGSIPGEIATVLVFGYQRDEVPAFDTRILVFTGIVQSVDFSKDGAEATINVRSLESALSKNVPRFTAAPTCGNFLFDSRCGVDPSLHNFIGTVSLVAGVDMTLTGAGASGHKFTGGYVRPVTENDFRMVIAQSTDVLTLNRALQHDQTGELVQAFAGCDLLIEGDCALVFDNVIEFNGKPFVPNRNPYQSGLPSV